MPPGGDSRLRIEAKGSELMVNGIHQLRLKGVIWRGPETGPKPVNGLHKHPLDWYLDFMVTHGFNAIRLPFNHRDVLDGATIDISELPYADPTWRGIDYVTMIKRVVQAAARKGILVLLACERLEHVPIPDTEGGGLWYGFDFPEEDIVRSWQKLAAALCRTDWNVFGVDLMDEPVRAYFVELPEQQQPERTNLQSFHSENPRLHRA